jgi:hypothetical protein
MNVAKMTAQQIIEHALCEDAELYNWLCADYGEDALLNLDVSDDDVRDSTVNFIVEHTEA